MHKLPETSLILRKFEQQDVGDLWRFRNDPVVTSGLGGFSTGYSRRDLEDWIEFHRSRTDEVLYAIIDGDTDQCVGHVGLYRIDHRSRKADFGILIGDPEYHGRGFGRKLTCFMAEYGFNQLNLNKVTLSVLSTNAIATALYEKMGFVKEGVSRQDLWKDGAFVDVVSMSMLRTEWGRQKS